MKKSNRIEEFEAWLNIRDIVLANEESKLRKTTLPKNIMDRKLHNIEHMRSRFAVALNLIDEYGLER